MLTTEPRSETAQPTGSTALIAEIAALRAEIATLRAQRDELVAALRDCHDLADRHSLLGISDEGEQIMAIARAAIARATGGGQ